MNMLKQTKMKTIYCLLILILVSCSTEPLADQKPTSHIRASVSLLSFNQTSKTPVPECLGVTPNRIRYTLSDFTGQTYTQYSDIVVTGNTVDVLDDMQFPSGTYDVSQIDLLNNNVVTHTAPHQVNNPDFRDFVQRPLPYSITLIPNQTYNAFDEFLCYTVDPIELDPNFQGDGEILELITIYFYIPENPAYDENNPEFCINQVTLTVDNYRIVEWPIFEPGLNSIPAPKDFNTAWLIAYDEDLNQLEQITFTEYNTDGILNQDDIIYFDNHCQ